jgi:hypothetical protein
MIRFRNLRFQREFFNRFLVAAVSRYENLPEHSATWSGDEEHLFRWEIDFPNTKHNFKLSL